MTKSTFFKFYPLCGRGPVRIHDGRIHDGRIQDGRINNTRRLAAKRAGV